jgi:hypothetical protein
MKTMPWYWRSHSRNGPPSWCRCRSRCRRPRATIGLVLFTSDCRKMTEFLGRATSYFSVAACRKSPMSLPAVNTPERPVKMKQRMAGLDCADSIASLIARYISCVRVFFFSGRRIVIVRVAPSSVTMMCSVMAFPAERFGNDCSTTQRGAAGHDSILPFMPAFP